MPEKKVILLIEDEKDIRALYAEVLRDAGYDVLEASDGEVGLDIAQHGEWDLMLLDIMIPKVDGVTLLKRMKADMETRKRPVILLTNLGSETLITECFEFGATGYLIKAEVTPDSIINEVKNYLKD